MGTLTPPAPTEVRTEFADCGDGYEWIADATAAGIDVISSWGTDGWDLGEWPYAIVGLADDTVVVTYTEGDVRYETFTSPADATRHIDTIAAWFWSRNGTGPADPAAGTGPYQPR